MHTSPEDTTIHGPRYPLVELRQYTLHPGQRDTLISLFEREFVLSQEALGMAVMAQFRDLDNPDRFVWLRGFAAMPARAEALAAFYGGPVWQAHRAAANATMIDSDDVLLLRPAPRHAALPIESWQRSSAAPRGALLALILSTKTAAEPTEVEAFIQRMAPLLAAQGGVFAGCYVTEPAPNNFPRLPVREGEHTIVWLARFTQFEALQAMAAHCESLAAPRATGDCDALLATLRTPPLVLKLAPTTQSRF
ncbi:NIPSNAP family protein [soil metagenome]